VSKQLRKEKEGSGQGHRLVIAYLGTPYSGWQRQPGKITVQETLENALRKIWGCAISAQASGRTDTGVHALGQVVSFIAPRQHAAPVLLRAINANLPQTIRVRQLKLVTPDFHARFNATGKTYEYRIWNTPVNDPFSIDLAWHVPRPLDEKKMRQAARWLEGRHDFASFTSNPGYKRESTVRTIRRLRLSRHGGMLVFTVTADGFLYRMVRNLVGALVKVGQGRLGVDDIRQILVARQRSAGPATAPACGLFLKKVYYS
jgi:tRNA pseudouridine38-40 synthase